MKTVAVIGSDGKIPKEVEAAVEKIGGELASNGIVVVCGGRGGVMEAVCRGAKSGGGLTVGVLPSLDKSEANQFVDLALPTGLGHSRNIIIAACCDAVIALRGSTGTLSEISLALNNKKHVFIVEDTGGVCARFKNLLEGDERGKLVHKTTSDKVVGDVVGFLNSV